MSKKDLNQNGKYKQLMISSFEPFFTFNNYSTNRLNISSENIQKLNKEEKLLKLRNKINSIENCKLKDNAKNFILGNGDINSPIMLIGGTPTIEEDSKASAFHGEVGKLLAKMLTAIKIKIKNVYLSYSINFQPPEDRKPTTQEIKRYSIFLKEHISIIDPKIIILMGSTAMESLTGSKNKVSNERGEWKEIILNNKTYPIIITFSPSFLMRYPENKKFSWEDLKKIRQKIQDLNIII